MKTEEYTECSNCKVEAPVRSMQDELPLDKPLCRKCRNAIPAAVEDLINRYDAYITKLETNRDTFQRLAIAFADSSDPSLDFTLAVENTHTKTLTRP